MDYWFGEQQARLAYLPDTRRYLFDRIDWSDRCIGILGARGTGKTTLMLQYLAATFPGSSKALYISVDHPKFQAQSLYDFGQAFSRYGGQVLFLDEVHKYEQWAAHIKTLMDMCPDLQVIFSGSSLLQLRTRDSDLSRRAAFYDLHGLSFREFLRFEAHYEFPILNLEDILTNHLACSQTILKVIKPLEHFRIYLRSGYYPFFMEGRQTYAMKLNEVIKQVLETDLPFALRVDIRQIAKLKKMIYLLAVNVPSQVNIQKFSASTEISRPKVYEYLEYLRQARLLNLIRGGGRGYKILSRPDKIYLENPNLAFALADETNAGTIRETFFVNQIRNALNPTPTLIESQVTTAAQGDFMIRDKLTFEVGGPGKGGQQIKNLDNAYIAADGIEAGFANKIPLWLFGFLY